MTIKQLLFCFGIAMTVSQLSGMAADNRYFPWYRQPYGRTVDKRSNVELDLFFITGNDAFGSSVKEKKGIPELWGIYDQKLLSEAMITAGLTSPLLAQWQLERKIEWDVSQKLEAQGVFLRAEWALPFSFFIGANSGIMSFNGNQSFSIPNVTKRDMSLTTSQEEELDRQRRLMNDLIGIIGTQWSETGFLYTQL